MNYFNVDFTLLPRTGLTGLHFTPLTPLTPVQSEDSVPLNSTMAINLFRGTLKVIAKHLSANRKEVYNRVASAEEEKKPKKDEMETS